MKKSKFLGNVSIIIVYALLAKVLSFIIELLMAVKFGANDQTDIFFMAYGIIQVLYPMISIGIWKVFMPEYKTRISLGEKDAASSITNKLLCVFLLIVTILSALIFAFPQLLIYVFAPGFDVEKVSACSDMLRILTFVFIFNTIATFCAAILQANGDFGKSQLKEVVQHLPPVVFLLVFTARYGISGVSFAILIGALLSAVVAGILTKKYYSFKAPKKRLFDRETIEILKSVPAACLNAIINQINGIVDRAFSSSLVVGALTYLNYGSRLIHLFDGIFSTAISTVLFPHITELVAKKEDNKLKVLLRDYLLIISAILIPISSFIIVFPTDLISVAFGYGNFLSEDVTSTSMVLKMYALSLPVMGITTVINDLFYVRKRANELLITTIICIVINVALDFLLIGKWGVAGLALATSIAYYLAFIIKVAMLKQDIIFDKQMIESISGVLIISIASISVCKLITSWILVHKILKLVIVFVVFVIIYMLLLIFLSSYYRNKLMSYLR